MAAERILVIANEGLEDPALLQAIQDLGVAGRDGATVRIAAPGARQGVGTDRERERGDTAARLARAVTVLRQSGLETRGHPADPDPIVALESGLAHFPATRIIISTFAVGRSKWLAGGLLEWAREATFAPVTHVVTEPRRAPVSALPITERLSVTPGVWRA